MPNPNANWNPGQIENDVIFGNSEHLFLAQGAHRVLDRVSGAKQISRESLMTFAQNIEGRKAECDTLNASFIHLICPDKNSVLREEFPFAQTTAIGETFADFVKNENVVIYARDLLKSMRNPYKKTDTHLTDAGSLEIVQDLMRRLGVTKDDVDLSTKYVIEVEQKAHIGDLGSKLSPNRESQEEMLRIPFRLKWLHNELQGGNNGIVDIRYAPDAPIDRRVLLFGDSFGRDICRYISLYYKNCIFLRTPYYHSEVANLYCPDIVITESVERYLDSCDKDANRPNFFMYPHLSNNNYFPSAVFANAFSGELSFGRYPYIKHKQLLIRSFEA